MVLLGESLDIFSLKVDLGESRSDDVRSRTGKKIKEESHEGRLAMLRASVNETANVYYTSSRMLDDGVIDPRDTRTTLAFCLHIIHGAPVYVLHFDRSYSKTDLLSPEFDRLGNP